MPHNMYHLDPNSALGKAMKKYSLAETGNTTPKSSVDKRVSTDDMIFKRALKKMYGLSAEQLSTLWPTIQNQAEGIMPDGTIAKNNDDIRLIKGDPLRTPTGVLEYKEDTPDENFPLKVSLESIKYEAESFLAAVDSVFEEYEIANIPSMTRHGVPSVNVLDNPDAEEVPGVEIITIDNTSISEEEEAGVEAKRKTASEVFGVRPQLLTQINAAGDLTGIAGTIFMVWKGFKYRFHYKREDSDGNEHKTVSSTDSWPHEQVLPPYNKQRKIAGLTNSIAGRNLEVFLKDRKMNYTDIEIVPAADINEIPHCSKPADYFWHQAQKRASIKDDDGKIVAPIPPVDSDIKWGSIQNDGYQYNTNELVYNELLYEPGDIIRASSYTDPGLKKKVFLPDQSNRWTEHHPHKTDKPENKDLTYKPTDSERSGKAWEGKLVRGYMFGLLNSMYTDIDLLGEEKDHLEDYFMVIRGRWRQLWPWHRITSYQGGPPAIVPDIRSKDGKYYVNNYFKREKSAVDGYHGKTYKVMSWHHMQYIASGVIRQTIDLEGFINNIDIPYYNFFKGGVEGYTPNGGSNNGGRWSTFYLKPATYADPGGRSLSTYPNSPSTAAPGVASERGDKWARVHEDVQGQYFKSLYSEPNEYGTDNGSFVWPYDIPGKISYKAKFTLKTKSRQNWTIGYRVRITDKDDKTVHTKSGSYKLYKKDEIYYKSVSKNNVTMHKGDILHLEAHQSSSKEKVKVEWVELHVTIELDDLHDTEELKREATIYFGINSQHGGMICEDGWFSTTQWMNYIQESDFYAQPHLEKYNELFSGKVSRNIEKTV